MVLPYGSPIIEDLYCLNGRFYDRKTKKDSGPLIRKTIIHDQPCWSFFCLLSKTYLLLVPFFLQHNNKGKILARLPTVMTQVVLSSE